MIRLLLTLCAVPGVEQAVIAVLRPYSGILAARQRLAGKGAHPLLSALPDPGRACCCLFPHSAGRNEGRPILPASPACTGADGAKRQGNRQARNSQRQGGSVVALGTREVAAALPQPAYVRRSNVGALHGVRTVCA